MNEEQHASSEPQRREEAIRKLVERHSGVETPRRLGFLESMVSTVLRLGRDRADTGELKLVATSLKELRYAYRVFRPWKNVPKISIFGSARTPEHHEDYRAAREFGRLMGEAGWMAITGAGDGIMKAGHEGPGQAKSFGLRIRLPFETTANSVIDKDPKLINFRYFFTRKVMFVTNSQAIVALPGGFGTMDELFEALTLIQTGKASPVPIILLEGEGGNYWSKWLSFIKEELLDNGWISEADLSLVEIASSPEDARDRTVRFYRNYHSSRYVGDKFVIRLKRPLTEEERETLESRFNQLSKDGRLECGKALPGEKFFLDLPRIHFRSRRRDFGVLRQLIDAINALPGPEPAS